MGQYPCPTLAGSDFPWNLVEPLLSILVIDIGLIMSWSPMFWSRPQSCYASFVLQNLHHVAG